jgi:hypothetical protein
MAFVCESLGDGLTQEEIADHVGKNVVEYDMKFVIFCTDFCTENKLLVKIKNLEKYHVTLLGKEFISSQHSQGLYINTGYFLTSISIGEYHIWVPKMEFV